MATLQCARCGKIVLCQYAQRKPLLETLRKYMTEEQWLVCISGTDIQYQGYEECEVQSIEDNEPDPQPYPHSRGTVT